MKFRGAVWKVGDHVSATDLVPARYDEYGMSRNWAECARHVLEDIDPSLAGRVRPGDLLLAGENLGAGHAHYYLTAIEGAAHAGFAAMFADSVGALYLRAAVDAGKPVWSIPGISSFAETGEELEVDLGAGRAVNLTRHTEREFEPVSPIVLGILEAGGSTPWAAARVHGALAR
ncbi:hypothetical protein [Amycolatopsis jejuensis]|uniref:hypothetical protein n=1 Tax=Amycolatopsis jejuensis TaxID=330084 RepID=UPI000523F6D7|nr:hypothetical protein [Amycolatopsis jejuensis]